MFSSILVSYLLLLLVDIFVLVRLGKYIGAWPAVLLIILAAVIGLTLVKREGMSVIRNIKWELAQGGIPGRQLMNGLLVLIGGLLFLSPGIVSDAIGFLLVMPGFRDRVREILIDYFRSRAGLGILNYKNRYKRRRLR